MSLEARSGREKDFRCRGGVGVFADGGRKACRECAWELGGRRVDRELRSVMGSSVWGMWISVERKVEWPSPGIDTTGVAPGNPRRKEAA